MIQYSIIVVTHNSADCISECLQSLTENGNETIGKEIIVIDNNSTDATLQVLQNWKSKVHVIENKTNVGFAAAVNQGAVAAQGEIILLVNPDAVLQPGALQKFMILFSGRADVAIAGCTFVDENGIRQPSCWYTPSIGTVLCESLLPYQLSLRLTTENPDETKEVEMVSGGCMAIRRSVFDQLQGFDERFFLYYEDADFCLRARQSKLKVFFVHDATIMHRGRKSTSSDLQSFFLHISTSKLRFIGKHFSGGSVRIARQIHLAGVLIRIPLYWGVGTFFGREYFSRLSRAHAAVFSALTRERLS